MTTLTLALARTPMAELSKLQKAATYDPLAGLDLVSLVALLPNAEFRAFLERDIAQNRKAIAIAGVQPE